MHSCVYAAAAFIHNMVCLKYYVDEVRFVRQNVLFGIFCVISSEVPLHRMIIVIVKLCTHITKCTAFSKSALFKFILKVAYYAG